MEGKIKEERARERGRKREGGRKGEKEKSKDQIYNSSLYIKILEQLLDSIGNVRARDCTPARLALPAFIFAALCLTVL